ncbi:MAG TPA: TRAP transporter small permease [Firmicutes bacterium]|nr:TRAP transporter small permease [Bacillota bacterium]
MLRILEGISARLNQVLVWIAGGALVLMMVILVTNMILRVVYVPFGGTAELVAFLAALVIAFTLGFSQITRAHVEIDLLVSRFSRRAGSILESLTLFLSMVLFSIAAWQIWLYAARQMARGILSETLRLPHYYLIYAVSIGFAALAIVLFVDLLKSVRGGDKK